MTQILPRHSCGSLGTFAHALLVASTLLSAAVTQAQVAHDHSPPAVPATAGTPSKPGATGAVATSPLPFESTLLRYKAMTDQKLGSWRDANDTVSRIGGWRNYLKEAQTPETKTATPAELATTPSVKTAPLSPVAPNPHAGHGAKP